MLSFNNLPPALVEQLTGCPHPVFRALAEQVAVLLKNGCGRPFSHSAKTMLALALMKLRMHLTVRALEALTGIDAVTVSRCVNRVVKALGKLPLADKGTSTLLVDTTSSRIASTELKAYSGYKHHRCAKVQVIARDDGHVVDVSPAYAGSVHDKRLWNKEAKRLKDLRSHLVLGDKAYAGAAGAAGENEHLLRPVKRGESVWKADPSKAKTFNKGLSRIRVRVEHVFARLKTWKVLSGLFPYRWERLGEIVRAIAVVHNLSRQFKRTAA